VEWEAIGPVPESTTFVRTHAISVEASHTIYVLHVCVVCPINWKLVRQRNTQLASSLGSFGKYGVSFSIHCNVLMLVVPWKHGDIFFRIMTVTIIDVV
jgi:hypothetical protein